MRKNLFKRLLAVVATAAICCTMATPMTAKTANPSLTDEDKCTHDIMLQGIHSEVIYTDSHSIHYYEDIDGDGYAELIVEECTINKVEYMHIWYCHGCEYWTRIEGMESWIEEVHSAAENSYHADE